MTIINQILYLLSLNAPPSIVYFWKRRLYYMNIQYSFSADTFHVKNKPSFFHFFLIESFHFIYDFNKINTHDVNSILLGKERGIVVEEEEYFTP